jgi:hypothetical protein
MKQNVTLTIASLLSILLLTLHITDDIVRGISKAQPSNIALAVLVLLLYGTLVLAERRSGYVIMLLVGLFAAVMPVIHMRGALAVRGIFTKMKRGNQLETQRIKLVVFLVYVFIVLKAYPLLKRSRNSRSRTARCKRFK